MVHIKSDIIYGVVLSFDESVEFFREFLPPNVEDDQDCLEEALYDVHHVFKGEQFSNRTRCEQVEKILKMKSSIKYIRNGFRAIRIPHDQTECNEEKIPDACFVVGVNASFYDRPLFMSDFIREMRNNEDAIEMDYKKMVSSLSDKMQEILSKKKAKDFYFVQDDCACCT